MTAKITALVSSQNGIPADTSVLQTIKILTPPEQLDSLCPNPELSLAGNNTRLTGKRSVIAQCGNKRKFVQISVQAQGTWWSARHAIKPGVVIQSEDIESRTGSLERLPAGLIFNKEHIIGQTTTRSISPGNPVLQNQLRARWAIMSGQAVEVIATGPGFRIRAKGKALDNAALGESLRITMRSGKIMTGVVSSEGKVDMNLEE
ncbi:MULTISPECIES: flagellar basal body P-ring formation chaperone FlgA [Yersinia]|uniref:flagellar basal body P-ring formation chaperone FlgA n=1 Tax=Yersinia TaxID=629 RepID=UPI001E34519D|nr:MULTISPECIES: flagellar basal body P-ring formation chaperone FlgA [Yersinia]